MSAPATAGPGTVKQRRRWGRRAQVGEGQHLNHPWGPDPQESPGSRGLARQSRGSPPPPWPEGAPRAGQRLRRGRVDPAALLGKGHLGLPGGGVVLRYRPPGRQPTVPTRASFRCGSALWRPPSKVYKVTRMSAGRGGAAGALPAAASGSLRPSHGRHRKAHDKKLMAFNPGRTRKTPSKICINFAALLLGGGWGGAVRHI
nr:uncharacterized protein MPDU1-AS1 isoform X4 [Gorilla gorilla gorilla]